MAVEGIPTRDEILAKVAEGDHASQKAMQMAETRAADAHEMVRKITRKNGNA